MTRIARIVFPGLPHHLTQRDNRRATVFFEAGDYELYRLFKEDGRVTEIPNGKRYDSPQSTTYDQGWRMGTAVGYAFIGAVALAVLSIAHAWAMKMKEQSRIAAEMFWYAGGLLPLALECGFLASNGDLPMVLQRIVLFCVGGLIGGATFVGIGEYIRPSPASAQTAQGTGAGTSGNQPHVNISGGENVVSIGQIGGITARVVNINPPLQPELRILEKAEVNNPDGSHTVTIKTQVASPITPGLLIVQIDAIGLQRVSIAPPALNGVSMMKLRNVRREQNSFSAEIPAPRGQYDIVVKTNSAVPITLNATF